MPSYVVKTDCKLYSTYPGPQRKLIRTSDGNLHCVYYRDIESYDQVCYAKSIDKGETWTETVLTSGNYHQRGPSIAVDSNNYLHVVWCGQVFGSGGGQYLRYQKFTTSWGSIENVTSEVGGFQDDPSIAVDSNNYLHVVWGGYHSASSTYFQIRYIKFTTSWGSIENLTSGDYHQYPPAIAVDSNNYLHVVWHGKHSASSTYEQIRYIKFTTSWGSIENLTSGDYHQYDPAIAVDSNDYIHVVWHGKHAGSTTYDQIRYRKYTDSWQSIENVTSGDYHQYRPVIAVDINNYLHVVWYGYHSGSATYSQIRYIKFTTSWGSIENLTSASADQISPNLFWSFYPIISGAKTNRLKNGYTLIWSDNTTTTFYKSTDLEWEGIDYDRTVDDSLGIDDVNTPSRGLSRVLSEALGVTDISTPSRGLSIVLTENIGVVDAEKKDELKLLMEALGITDLMLKDFMRRVTSSTLVTIGGLGCN